MIITMPIVINGKSLFDSGNAIEDQKTLDKVIQNGVKRVDVSGSYAKELAEQYPDDYKGHNDQINAAKESGRLRRVDNAEFLMKIRELEPKSPVLSICASIDYASDIKKQIISYFRIEETFSLLGQSIFNDMVKAKLLVISLDCWTEENIKQFMSQYKQKKCNFHILGIYKNKFYPVTNTLYFCDNGSQLMKACFYLTASEENTLRLKNPPYGAQITTLNRPLIQIISDFKTYDECVNFSMNYTNSDMTFHSVETYHQNPVTMLTLLYIDEIEGSLTKLLLELKQKQMNFNKLLIIISKITKDNAEEIKKLGNIKVLLGNLDNSKLKAFMMNLKP